MKVFAVVFAVLVAAVAFVAAGGYGGSSGGGAASMPAIPCPKNYVFSCQPSLQLAPCSSKSSGGYGSSSGGYGGSAGSAGAYSEPLPTYVNAPLPVGYHYQGLQY